eukprot:gene12004-2587_t
MFKAVLQELKEEEVDPDLQEDTDHGPLGAKTGKDTMNEMVQENEEEVDDDTQMMQMMGFSSFDTTKGKHVKGQMEGCVKIEKAKKYSLASPAFNPQPCSQSLYSESCSLSLKPPALHPSLALPALHPQPCSPSLYSESRSLSVKPPALQPQSLTLRFAAPSWQPLDPYACA